MYSLNLNFHHVFQPVQRYLNVKAEVTRDVTSTGQEALFIEGAGTASTTNVPVDGSKLFRYFLY